MATDTDTLLTKIDHAVDVLLEAQSTVINFAVTDGGPVFARGDQTVQGEKTFVESPLVPAPAAGDYSAKAASTSFVQDAIAGSNASGSVTVEKNFTVSPTVPTLAASDSSTKVANSAFVHAAIDAENSKAKSVSGVMTFTSSPVVPTLTAGDNSTKAASTAFVQSAINAHDATNHTVSATVTHSASPLVPTAVAGDKSTKAASTEYVLNAIAANNSDGCDFTGEVHFTVSPTAPTPDSTDNSGKLATTSFVRNALSGLTDTVTTATNANRLTTARTINGTSFDGTANITTANWGTARNVSIADSDATNTGTAVSVNGSGNVTLKLPATIKATITGGCSGNAGTATKLATARNINGTSFDGSAAITTANWGTARNITIKDADSTNAGTAVSVNGSAAVTLLLPSTIKASITGNCSGSSGSCTGNAATATILATGRTINGTSFNGSANITTSSWGTARNFYLADSDITNKGAAVSVNGSDAVTLKLPSTIKASITGNCSGSSGSCTGNAETASKATQLTNTRTIWGQNFNGTANITGGISNVTSIEFNGLATSATNGGLIDFHYAGSTSDYTSRIIENASGQISINSVLFKSGLVTCNQAFGAVVAVSASAIDVSTGSCFTKTITANTTFTFTGVASGKCATFTLILTNGGSKTITWPTVNWSVGTPPTLTASGKDVLTFITADGGTSWYGVVSSIEASAPATNQSEPLTTE